jgi:hypothetical protein
VHVESGVCPSERLPVRTLWSGSTTGEVGDVRGFAPRTTMGLRWFAIALIVAPLGCAGDVPVDEAPPAAALTAERIAAQLAVVVERSEGLTEASVVCDHTGPVQPGDISVCMYMAEGVGGTGPMFAVLDTSRVAWLPWWSSYPTSTARVRVLHRYAPSGLDCRDLLSGAAPYPFGVSGVRPEEAVLWSIVYWILEGQPARMDVDGNGIPCESLYDAEVVASVVHEVSP